MDKQGTTQTVAEQIAQEVALAVERLFSTAGESVRKLLPVDRFYAVLYDTERDMVSFPLVLPQDAKFPAAPRKLEMARLPDWLLCRREAASFCGEGAAFRAALREKRLRYWPGRRLPLAWLGAPLVVEEQVLGALVIENYRSQEAFGQTGAAILATVARQAAVAIRNARLDGQMKRKALSMEVVSRLGQQLASGIHLGEEEILKLIHENASRLMDTSNMYIALYDEATDAVSFPLMYVDGQPMQVEARSGGKGRTEWIIRHRQPLLIRTRTESEEWYRREGTEYIGEPFASWVGVPMLRGEKALGVIATYHKTEDYVYDEDDQLVLSLMAGQAAVAIENARLFRELEKRTKQLEEVNKKIAVAQELYTRQIIALDFVHRMRNLAGTIPIWTGLLRQEIKSLYDTADSYLQDIETDVRNLLDAATQLQKPLQREDVDVKFVLESLLRQVQIQYGDDVSIEQFIEQDLGHVSSVPFQLSSAFWSVIVNGIEAMPCGGKLTVRAVNQEDETGASWISVEISDEGIGISEEELPNIFTPLYSTKGQLGYGLYSAKIFVEQIGGTIDCKSQQGVGTTFIIRLPRQRLGGEVKDASAG